MRYLIPACSVLWLTCAAPAEVIEVCPEGCEFSVIHFALDAANDGDTIFVAAGTYYGSYLNPRGKAVTIVGETNLDGSLAVTLDGMQSGAVIECFSGEGSDTVFRNLRLVNGSSYYSGGISLVFESSPRIEGCILEANTGTIEGGGMHLREQCNPEIVNCHFKDNTSYGSGGGIHCIQSSPRIINCTFQNNSASDQGQAVSSFDGSNPVLALNQFCQNSSDVIDGPWIDNGGNEFSSSCPINCAGDISGDGSVGVNDLLAVIAAWGECDQGVGTTNDLLDRHRPTDLRIAAWNIEWDCSICPPPFHLGEEDVDVSTYARILKALDADVYVLNEIDSDQTVELLPSWLDETIGSGPWQIHVGTTTGSQRNVLASRLPMSMLETNTIPSSWSAGRGITMALIDCPDAQWTTDLYLMGVHLKCCSYPGDEDARQESADSIANWIGDAMTPGEQIDLPQGTPMVLGGDLNFYDEGLSPEVTIRSGSIVDNSIYGPDTNVDWDGSHLFDPMPADPTTGNTSTHSWDSYSRPDRFIATDSVLEFGNTFILNTATLSVANLEQYDLEATDSLDTVTSDHLPVVIDVRPPGSCPEDLNGDGHIGVSDLLIVIAQWGLCD